MRPLAASSLRARAVAGGTLAEGSCSHRRHAAPSPLPLQALPLQALPLQALPLQALPLQALPLQVLPLQVLPLQAFRLSL